MKLVDGQAEETHSLKENILSKKIIGCCIRVHKNLGPGLLESVYEEGLACELSRTNIKYERQEDIAVKYEDIRLNVGFRADIIVEDKVLIELKSVDKLVGLHFKQVSFFTCIHPPVFKSIHPGTAKCTNLCNRMIP